ncbi:MAG: 30S ribosomal protein S20 [Patescibacteria group bacterium]|nr:30S ribosomal protein S20 [Patescibacteria group bacterium]
MPITKSAKKAYVSSERKRAHNVELEKKLKLSLKKVNKENTNETISVIDKMAKRHIISKNKAGHLKSSIAKKFGTPKAEKKVAPVAKKTAVKKTATKTKTSPKTKK